MHSRRCASLTSRCVEYMGGGGGVSETEADGLAPQSPVRSRRLARPRSEQGAHTSETAALSTGGPGALDAIRRRIFSPPPLPPPPLPHLLLVQVTAALNRIQCRLCSESIAASFLRLVAEAGAPGVEVRRAPPADWSSTVCGALRFPLSALPPTLNADPVNPPPPPPPPYTHKHTHAPI